MKHKRVRQTKRVKCIVCDKILEAESFSGQEYYHTVGMDGVSFQSNGNWGSTVIDMDCGKIEIIVCDECLIKKASSIDYIYGIGGSMVAKRKKFSEEIKQRKLQCQDPKK